MYSQVGNASPAYCTGVGKAALSALPEQQLDQTLRNMRFQRFTDHTITTVSALRSELDAIRDSGVARDREEHEPGIRCIAAPIHSIDRSFVGGISVTGPAFRVPEDMLTRWEPLVSAAAKSINGELGARLGPRT
jgi:DNA-binding IclR family transcriptional regulator